LNVATSNLDRFFARLATLGSSNAPATGAIVPPLFPQVSNTSPQRSSTPVASQASTVSVSDGARLRASLFDLRTVVNRINTSGEVAGILTTNTNSNLTGTVTDDSRAVGTNSVTVTQKAQAQRVQSQDLRDDALVGAGSLSVQFGNYNAALNSFTPGKDAPKSVAIGVLDSTIDGVTTAVNRSNLGVTAKVLQDGGALKIELTGNASGRDQAFKVTASDSPPLDTPAPVASPVASASDPAAQAASDTSLLETVVALPGSALSTRTDLNLGDSSTQTPAAVPPPIVASPAPVASSPPPGLSRLSFDPANQAAAGKGTSLIDAAQDVIGTVNGEAFTGGSNQVADVLPGATLQVAATGTGTIQFRRDPDQAISSARTLVDSFNHYREQTSNSVLAQQLGNKLNSALADAQGRSGNDRRTLAEIGVERGSDGSLKLNEEKFKQSFAQNSESTVGVIEDAASRVATIADDALNGILKQPAPVASRNTSAGLRSSSSAADDFFAAQLRLQQFQTLPNIKPSLITYTPTTSNLYGLAQYLAVGGL